MIASLPKRHHYVPQMLQKRFVDSEGWLHAFSRVRADRSVYPVRPAKLFVEKHLYSETHADGSLDVETERAFSRLEHRVDPIIEKIIAAARVGRRPELSPEETTLWQFFVVMQWKRVPDLHLTVTTDDELAGTFDELLAELRASQPHLIEEIDKLATYPQRKRMMKNARVGALGGVSQEVMDAMRSRGLAIAVSDDPRGSLTLGSRPVVKLTTPGRTDIRHPACELWLPVASDVVVGLGVGEGTETVVPITRAQIRQLNLACVCQSTVFASASAALTASLAHPR